MQRRSLATLALLALCVSQPACLTASQWEPKVSKSTIAGIAVAEIGAAALFAAPSEKDPNGDSEWNKTPYGLRAAEMFGCFAALDLLVFGLMHADLSHTK